MGFSRTALLCLALALICLISQGQSYASVVTVDVGQKTAASDVSNLETRDVKFQGDQIGLLVRNKMVTPHRFTLKVSGLKDQDYDVYLNQAFKWSKPAKDIEAGFEITVGGGTVDAASMRCLKAIVEPLKKAIEKLRTSKYPETERVSYTLNLALVWASTAANDEQRGRSVSIIIAPSGKMLQPMSMPAWQTDAETAASVTRACWLIQQARDRMYHAIKNPILRNDAVVALTPVEFTATYSVRNGKPHIEARVVNNCNIPVSGKVSMALPAGWKSTAKKLALSGLKSGETFKVSFDLVAPSKTAVAPDKVPMAANLTVVQQRFTAALRLTATAQAEAK